MIYVSEIKTITGVYYSFWKVVQEEKRKFSFKDFPLQP